MKFTTGDHVRVIARGCRHFDATGTVAEINEGAHYPFRIAGLDDHLLYFGAHELILAEAPVPTETAR